MAKFTNYLFLMSGFIAVFWAFGILDGGATSKFLEIIINPTNIKASDFLLFDSVLGIVTAALVTAAGLLLIARYKPDLTIFAVAIPILLIYMNDLFVIFNHLKDINEVFAALIMSPLIIVYTMTVMEWWRGVTT